MIEKPVLYSSYTQPLQHWMLLFRKDLFLEVAAVLIVLSQNALQDQNATLFAKQLGRRVPF